MQNLYVFLSYRAALKKCVESQKDEPSGLNFAALAKHMRIQKSYFSKVLHAKAHLNSDQLFLAAQALRFDEEAAHYLQLLLEFDRTALQVRRDLIRQKIDGIRAQKLELKAQISAPSIEAEQQKMRLYHLDPIHQLVHMALTIPKYSANTRLLETLFSLNRERVKQILGQLEQMNLIHQTNNHSATAAMQSMHFPRDSEGYKAWAQLLRTLGQARSQWVEKNQSYQFSVVFSGQAELQEEIRFHFVEFLKTIEIKVKTSKPAELYQMNFDLLRWT